MVAEIALQWYSLACILTSQTWQAKLFKWDLLVQGLLLFSLSQANHRLFVLVKAVLLGLRLLVFSWNGSHFLEGVCMAFFHQVSYVQIVPVGGRVRLGALWVIGWLAVFDGQALA